MAEGSQSATKRIWTVFWILSAITAFEFFIAFVLKAGTIKTSIFVIMTLVKAFYIIGEFMHLKHEVKALIWTVILPITFIAWLLLALMYFEGGYLFDELQSRFLKK